MNYYDELYVRLIGDGASLAVAVERVADVYLDRKPRKVGKTKLLDGDRDTLFWSSNTVRDCPPDLWNAEAMVLALAQYFGQESVAAEGLATRVAHEAPEALIRAVRYSGLVLKEPSFRRSELDKAAVGNPAVAELCRVLDVFDRARHERVAVVDKLKARLANLSAFDLLLYASLYAFERLVSRGFKANVPVPSAAVQQFAWDALNDLLVWKLEGAEIASLELTDDSIGRSIIQHLRPILFESRGANSTAARDNLRAFHALMAEQVELNDFTARSAEAFCYDDAIRFERRGDRLEIVELDPASQAAWEVNGRKLDRLHAYWFHRAIEAFAACVASDPTRWKIGRPENEDANRLAFVRALQAQMRLQEVYGVDDDVSSGAEQTVNLFEALLSLNLMSVFFQQDFLAAFADRLDTSGNWITALQRLAMDGVRDGLQNRLPLTWSGKDQKATNIARWTATESEPKGNPSRASAILDFWTYDMVSIAERLDRHESGLQPALFERPVLKFGATLVQLPWVVGMQNNTSAAINNLRRLGARRGQARAEAHRIEAGLARLFEDRGFRTLLTWTPPREAEDAGEVDLIAILGQHLFVIEVKSTFLRRSHQDAWLHATGTLRKAGHQLRRKVDAVSRAIASNPEFRAMLRVTEDQVPAQLYGLIADTSIECDHERFSGFLKVSVEELLIALRDDRHVLNDSESFLAGDKPCEAETRKSVWTLYPNGFSAERFIEVIETEAVWAQPFTLSS